MEMRSRCAALLFWRIGAPEAGAFSTPPFLTRNAYRVYGLSVVSQRRHAFRRAARSADQDFSNPGSRRLKAGQ
jgi:hypothetical protein